jgi:hypothetical protein
MTMSMDVARRRDLSHRDFARLFVPAGLSD